VPAKSEPTTTEGPTDADVEAAPKPKSKAKSNVRAKTKAESSATVVLHGHERKPFAPSFVATAIAAGLFMAVAVVLLLFLVHEKNQADKLGAEQTDISSVQLTATQVAENIVRWDASGNAAQRETLVRLSNGPVLSQYDGAIKTLDATFPALGATSVRATVQEVYVGAIDGDEVQVVVVVDLEVAGKNPHTVPNHYLRVHLSRIARVWKVDDVKDVNTALAATGSAGATTSVPDTTPTTVPDTSASTSTN